MKKFMRIALVFALAGATLVGCTKDYSGDISDLNKKVAEQQSAVTALQNAVSNAQTAADNALANAQNALKEAQEAAKAAAAANNDAEVAALTERVAAIEGEIAELEAKVEALDGLEAKLNEVAEQLKKDVDAKVDAALEEVRAELEEALAKVEGNFSVAAPIPNEVLVKYAADVWSPSTTKSDIAKLAKLVEAFPELAEIKKGDAIEMFGKLPFTVSPASLELDDTYSFSLVSTNGADAHVALGNPTEGFRLKSTAGVWSVDVMSPAFNAYGQVLDYKDRLALVIEDANGNAAQTQFVYEVEASINEVSSSNFALNLNEGGENANVFTVRYQDPACGFYGNTIDLSYFATTSGYVCDVTETADGSAPLYENYFLIESTDDADIEKYGVSIDGSEVTIDNGPEAGDPDGYIQLMITAVGVNGKVDQKTIKLQVKAAYLAPNAELTAKEVTLGVKDNDYNVAVDYDMDDFGFSALETKEVFNALNGKSNTVSVYNAKGEKIDITTGKVEFFKAGGKAAATSYSDAAILRVTVKSDAVNALPGVYTIRITDGSVFCAEGALTLVNPETCPIKLIDALCKDGVLQIVGEVSDGNIVYALKNALVFNANEVELTENSFYDEDQTSSDEDNWVISGTTFCIPVATAEQNLLYTTRNFSVKFGWFGNANNPGKFEFQAQAVSPIWAEGGKGAVEVANQTIYLGGDDKTEFKYFEVNKIVKSAKYVAGDKVNKPYNVFQGWKENPAVPKTFLHTYTATASNYSGTAVPEAQQHWGEGSNSVVDGTQLMIDNNSDFIIIEKTGNILRGFGLTNNEILAVQTAKEPLYLTDNMANHAGASWILYYDNYGKPRAAKLSNGKKVYGQAWAKYVDGKTTAVPTATCDGTVTYFTGKDENFVKATIAGTLTTASDAEINEIYAKVCSEFIFDDDKNAVAAYNVLKPYFDKVTEDLDPDAPTPAGKQWVTDDTIKPASEISVVKIGFKNPVEAAKFVKNVGEITEAYLPTSEGKNSCKIEVNPNAEFKAGLTSVDLPAYIKIADNRGMTMEIPFTVTVKVASK